LGWNVGVYQGTRTISHGGYGGGWSAQLILFPERNQSLAITSLVESPSIFRIRQAVLDTLFGETPQVGKVSWIEPICQAFETGGIKAAQTQFYQMKADGFTG